MAGDSGPLAWHAVDTRNYNVNLYHFAYALNKPTSNVLFWAVTVVDVAARAAGRPPGDRLERRLGVVGQRRGSRSALYNDRQAVIDDGVSKRLTLRQGANVIRAAIVNAGGATDFCARFIDEAGQPVKRFTVRLDTGAPSR